MRLGPLILQVCAVLIALLLIFAGYSFFESRDLEKYVEALQSDTGLTPGQRVEIFKDAPDFKCEFFVSDISTPTRGHIYVTAGKLRYDTEVFVEKTVLHRLFDSTGLYFWEDDWQFVEHAGRDTIYVEILPRSSDYSFDCERWEIDKSVFELPLGKPIREARFRDGDMILP